MNKKNQLAPRFQAKDLVPEWWYYLREMDAIEDIEFLGSINIRQMVRSWRGTAKDITRRIKAVDERLSLLQGKTADDFAAEAQNYENPQFKPEDIGVRPDSWSGDPEPLDAASMNREHDATTLNLCGWCKYAGGGSGRYSYMISTSCSFITYAGMEDTGKSIPKGTRRRYAQTLTLSWQAKGGELQAANEALRRMEATYPGIREVVTLTVEPNTKRRFNTPCFLPYAGKKLLDELRIALDTERDRLVTEKREVDEKIKFLLSLAKSTERKPALAHYRPHDWFNLNDPVVCFIGEWDERTISDHWATALVINGYRHHDGCVSVAYAKRVHTGEYLDGHGGGYGMSRPEVMHAWEYDYLRDHPDFAQVWLDSAMKDLRDFHPGEMLEALTTAEKLPLPDGIRMITAESSKGIDPAEQMLDELISEDTTPPSEES